MLESQNWKGKISNIKQLGGIETSVIDNGPGRGNRIAWVNTGTGLRYKIVIDRAMDIADAFYNQHSIAWLSGLGVSAPQPFSDKGLNWLRTFGGGLLVTCGLTHIGGFGVAIQPRAPEDARGFVQLIQQVVHSAASPISFLQCQAMRPSRTRASDTTRTTASGPA